MIMISRVTMETIGFANCSSSPSVLVASRRILFCWMAQEIRPLSSHRNKRDREINVNQWEHLFSKNDGMVCPVLFHLRSIHCCSARPSPQRPHFFEDLSIRLEKCTKRRKRNRERKIIMVSKEWWKEALWKMFLGLDGDDHGINVRSNSPGLVSSCMGSRSSPNENSAILNINVGRRSCNNAEVYQSCFSIWASQCWTWSVASVQ